MFSVSLISGMCLTSVVVMVTRKELMCCSQCGPSNSFSLIPADLKKSVGVRESLCRQNLPLSSILSCTTQRETPALTRARVFGREGESLPYKIRNVA